MSSTNKTTNYELSQYVGSDKPTYLGDYNSDMAKIDAGMQANKVASQTANANAETANQNASDALTAANTASTNAGNAQTSANSALAKATANETLINNFINYLNLVNFDTYTNNNMNRVSGSGTIKSTSKITVASNSTRDVAKIYGRIQVENVTTAGNIQIQTNLRPSSPLNIDGVCLRAIARNDYSYTTNFVTFSIDTNGLLTVPFTWAYTGDTCDLMFIACLLFLKDFGDTVIN